MTDDGGRSEGNDMRSVPESDHRGIVFSRYDLPAVRIKCDNWGVLL